MGKSYVLEHGELSMELVLGNSLQKRFRTRRSKEQSVVFDHCSEYVLYIRDGEAVRLVSDTDCTPCAESMKAGGVPYVEAMVSGRELVMRYDHEAVCVEIHYINDGYVIHKKMKVTAKHRLMLVQHQSELLHTDLPLARGGEGQPVFIGGRLFTGIEYPSARNEYTGDCVFLQQYPYLSLGAGESYELPPVVYGFRYDETIEETFMNYIWRASPVRYKTAPSIYNEWAAHDELGSGPELTETLVGRQLDRLERLKSETGFCFDYYTMDAFWFEENVPYLKFKSRTWPQGPEAVRQRIRSLGMRFGLWFDVNSDLVKLENAECNNRFNCTYKKCLADPNYLKLLQEGILYNIKTYDLHMIKLDFADFDCEDREHDYHGPTKRTSKDAAVRGLIGVLDNIRKARPDMIIMAYNGFTTTLDWLVSVDPGRPGYAISPWWAFYLEYIYCGDPRPSEFPAISFRHSVDWYIDGMVRTFYESLLPLPFIDDCGVMVGAAETIYDLGSANWRDGWMLSLSRGGKKAHFYGNLELLNDSDFAFIKASRPMFEKLRGNDGAVSTRLILGDARLGQPYGYSNASGFEGYLTLINPTGMTRAVTLALPVWSAGGRRLIREFYRNSQVACTPWECMGDTYCVTLEPEAVVVYEWCTVEAVRDMSGVLSLLPDTAAVLHLPEDGADCLAVRFFGENGEPARSYSIPPVGFCAGGAAVRSLMDRKVWSGLSWNLYELNEDRDVLFENRSGDEMRFVWKTCKTGGIV